MDSVKSPDSNTFKRVIMPETKKMSERLEAVENDYHVREKLFPTLLKSAGTQQNVWGVVYMLDAAVNTYIKTFEEPAQIILGLKFEHSKPSYLEALIVDDSDALIAAQKLLNQTS